VDLLQDGAKASLTSGEQVELVRNQTPRVTRILIAQRLIQWCLYYPGVVHLGDLDLTPSERASLAASLSAWQKGSVREALRSYPASPLPNPSAAALLYLAGLRLAAGDVDEAERLLEAIDVSQPIAEALREVIAAVRFEGIAQLPTPNSASTWLARSYYLQSQSRLPEAREAARSAVSAAADFGFAWIRLAELHLAFDDRRAAESALTRGLSLSPDSAPAHSLQGFLDLRRYRARQALEGFDRAHELDGALGNAWLGRGLALGQQGRSEEARRALQVAAALEPQRSELRSYLGKAWAETRDSSRAQREFQLARQLDPGDPTPWLYSALDHQQNQLPNQAVRDLERSHRPQ
jgi:tetratricopeptide (TPR) repeat protein